MTKGECIIDELGFVRNPAHDKTEKKHDDSFYTVRCYCADINGNQWVADCDSYYGRTILWVNGKRLGDFEYRYEAIKPLVDSFLPVLHR